MKKVYLIPRKGLRPRKPDGRVLPPEGAWVTHSPYWRRRLKDGDVTEGRPPKPAKQQAKQDQQKGAE